MPKRIIVLGTMRSGTSLVAELIRLWGAYAGAEETLWKSDSADPRGYGYMEYIPLQELNDELLDHNDRMPPLLEVMEAKAENQDFRRQASGLLEAMDERAAKDQAPAWVWKDARLPLTLPFWVNQWEDVIYVIAVRHPAEITLSAAKAQDFQEETPPFAAGLLYWQYCMLNVITYTQNNPNKIFLAYDQVISNPDQECSRLAEFLDLQCSLPRASSEQRHSMMRSAIAGNQRHYDYRKSLAEIEQATKEQRALYNFLRVKTVYPDEAFNRDDFALYPGWKEFLESLDALLTLSNKLDTWATQPPPQFNQDEG
jgi:hypothetical protein